MRETEKNTKKQGGDDRDFVREVAQLLEQYPELKGKTIPQKVVRAALEGMTLLEAYEAYLAERSAAEIEENDSRQQNQRAAKKAPVTGVTGGSAVTAQGEDDFLRGFNA